MLRSPDGRIANLALPSAARGSPSGDDLGGDFNGILDGRSFPEAFAALVGARALGEWELRVQTSGPLSMVVRAKLFLTTTRQGPRGTPPAELAKWTPPNDRMTATMRVREK